MARRLRIQYPGAIYHVINRGNYRRDVFENAATAKAFETTIGETCERFQWRIHAYVILRNHYHLAVETPEPNLVAGMHWLQSTFATRFNRLRSESGHLFQGRYQSLLVEDAHALARVVDYIHLNPVRARIVTPEHVAAFRWSSLARFIKQLRPAWLVGAHWLEAHGLSDSPSDWRHYVARLSELAADEKRQQEEGVTGLAQGWAIGSAGWRRAVAKDHANLKLAVGCTAEEIRELREARWRTLLDEQLQLKGKTLEEAANDAKGALWKIEAAEALRREAGVPHQWIARELGMGSPHSVRSYLSRRAKNQQTSA